MDLSSVLPDFPTKPYAHIIPSLERSRITTVDLITLDTLEIARRAHVPHADVRRLITQLTRALHHDVGFEDRLGPDAAEPSSSINLDTPVVLGPATQPDLSQWSAISTLDPALDTLLGGGIPTRYLTEVTGESGSGKTQFLLTLLLAAQLPAPHGLNGRTAIYISTEAPLSTPRLSQLLDSHPYLSTLARDDAPSLEKILSINAMDLESQEHIFNYQLPVAVARYNVGLVVVDSITSNYRAEHSSHSLQGLSTRSGELTKLGQLLRNLAVTADIAIVVANQVSDRFEGIEGGGGNDSSAPYRTIATPFSSSPSTQHNHPPHQQLSPPNQEAVPSPLSRPPLPTPGGETTTNPEISQSNLILPSSPPLFSSSPYAAEEDPHEQQQQQSQQFDGSYLVGNPVRNELLSLFHQQRFFTGWGDDSPSLYPDGIVGFQRNQAQKTPTLGLVWSTQIACRIALKKEVRSLTVDPLLGGQTGYGTEPSTPFQPIETREVLVERPSKDRDKDRDKDKGEGDDKNEEQEQDIEDVPDQDPPGTSSVSPVKKEEDRDDPVAERAKVSKTETETEPEPKSQPERQSQPQSQAYPPPTHGLTRRTMKLVFAPWAADSAGEVEFTIWKGGLRSEGGSTLT